MGGAHQLGVMSLYLTGCSFTDLAAEEGREVCEVLMFFIEATASILDNGFFVPLFCGAYRIGEDENPAAATVEALPAKKPRRSLKC